MTDRGSIPMAVKLDYERRNGTDAGPAPYAWGVVALLFVVAVLNYLDRLMITTMVEPIRNEFAIDNKHIGLFTSVFLWIYAACSPFGGFLADRFSRSAVIVASLLFWSAATCISGFAHNFRELLLARGLMGISEACYMPAALALIADYHRGRTRSLATGLHMAGIYTGAALGGLGGFIAELRGWRFGFKVFGIFGIAYAIVLLLSLRDVNNRDTRTPEPQERPEFGQIFAALGASRGFVLLFVVNVLVGIFNWSIYAWLPVYLKERFHLGLGASGMSATFYVQCASFVGVLLAGFVADRWSRSNRRARSLVPAIGFCIAGPCLMGTGTTGILLLAIAGLIVVGLGRGSFDANHMPILRELVDQRYSATGFGVLNLISTAAGGAMVYAAGALRDANVNLSLVFQGCGVAMLAAGILLIGVGISTSNLGGSDGN